MLTGRKRMEFINDQKGRGHTLKEIAPMLNLSYSSLRNWIANNKNNYRDNPHLPHQRTETHQTATINNEDDNTHEEICDEIDEFFNESEFDFDTITDQQFDMIYHQLLKDRQTCRQIGKPYQGWKYHNKQREKNHQGLYRGREVIHHCLLTTT
jgi:transposase